jgi:hypothetical protein
MRKLAPAIRTFEHRRIKPEAKTVDPFYLTPEYQAWREKVISKAGGRCEAVERDARCRKAQPRHRMFADHIKEVRDGGARFDPTNGQCLCGRHHTLKTTEARAARLASPSA